MTIIYSNTDKPYAEWKPVYEIVALWDGGTPRFHRIPFEILKPAKDLASSLMRDFARGQKFGMNRTNVARYRKDILEAASILLQSKGFSFEVKINDIKNNHCHTITVRKK